VLPQEQQRAPHEQQPVEQHVPQPDRLLAPREQQPVGKGKVADQTQ